MKNHRHPPSPCARIALALAGIGLLTSAWGARAAEPAQGVIVKYKATQDAGALSRTERLATLDLAARRHGVSLSRIRGLATGGELVRPNARLGEADLKALIAELSADPRVEYAEEDVRLTADSIPNDPRFNEQWHYFESAGGINAPAAWDLSTGANIKVAVLDTGFRPHADLAANIVGGFDFITDTFKSKDDDGRDGDPRDPGSSCSASESSSWHGTHVSGTIAAISNNGTGVAGVAPGAKVVPLRVLGCTGGDLSDIADAIIWAAGGTVSGVPGNSNRARVLNLSLGGDSNGCSQSMQTAIDDARLLGATVVVAAGNENINAETRTPANCNGTVVVAATNRSGGRAIFNSSRTRASNFGSIVDLAAPGGSVVSSTADGVLSTLNAGFSTPGADSFEFFQGTSMATPHVAGVAALMLSVKPTLNPVQTENLLKSTTRAFPQTCSQCGTGILDARAAVEAAQATTGLGGGACATGFARTFRNLNIASQTAFIPSEAGFASTANVAALRARLGGLGVLQLQRRNGDGTFSAVANGSGGGLISKIDIPQTPGTYRWAVSMPSSKGLTPVQISFTLCTRMDPLV